MRERGMRTALAQREPADDKKVSEHARLRDGVLQNDYCSLNEKNRARADEKNNSHFMLPG
jgi:hypothetical protein